MDLDLDLDLDPWTKDQDQRVRSTVWVDCETVWGARQSEPPDPGPRTDQDQVLYGPGPGPLDQGPGFCSSLPPFLPRFRVSRFGGFEVSSRPMFV